MIFGEVASLQTAVVPLMLAVGKGFTTTLPVLFKEAQPLALLTLKVKGIDIPEAAALKLTVIGLLSNTASVTAVKPVPEMEYVVGVPDVAV